MELNGLFRMKELLKNKGYKLFLILYIVFAIIGTAIILFSSRGDVLLFINDISRIQWDTTVNLITDIGLGGFMVIVSLILVVFKIRYAIAGLLNLALVGLFTNTLKSFFKADWFRPLHYFLYDDLPRFIYTAELNYFSTFPSGHTMTIFAMMGLFAYLFKKKALAILFFVMAVLVALSRVYLLQHFFIDVFAGAFLGMICTFIILWLSEYKIGFLKRGAFDKSLIQLFGKNEQ